MLGLYWLGCHHFYNNDFVSLVGKFVVLGARIIIIIMLMHKTELIDASTSEVCYVCNFFQIHFISEYILHYNYVFLL